MPSLLLSLHCTRDPSVLHSFPTRRSSDLRLLGTHLFLEPGQLACGVENVDRADRALHLRLGIGGALAGDQGVLAVAQVGELLLHDRQARLEDRKSTRLNSSHVAISYAVFCLKKNKKNKE